MPRQKQAEQDTLASLIINHTRADTYKYEGRDGWDKWLPLTDKQILAVAPEDRNYAWYGHVIGRVPSYFVPDFVRDQVTSYGVSLDENPAKMERTLTMLKEHPELMQAKFPAMVVEYNSHGGDRIAALILQDHTIRGSSTYIFAENSQQKDIVPSNGNLIHVGSSAISGKSTITLPASLKVNTTIENYFSAVSQFMNTSLMFFNTRASVMKLVEPRFGDYQNLKIREAMRTSKPVTKHHGELTFDLSRIIAKGYAKTEAEAMRVLKEQLVIGHPKLRRVRTRDETGKPDGRYASRWIFWSAHFRGGTDEEKASRPDRIAVAARTARVVMKRPGRDLIVAGMDSVD